MKIVFVIKTLAHVKGGAERVLAMVANGLVQKSGYDVRILTFDSTGSESTYPLEKSIKLTCLNVGDVGKKSSLRDVARRAVLLRKVLKRESPDVVIPFLGSAFVSTSMAVIFTGIPVLASEHSVFMASKSPLVCLPFALSTFGVKKITCLSDSVKSTFPWIIRRKMHSIPNPIPREMFDVTREKRSAGRRMFLSVGRLEKPKDFATLIAAFDLVTGELPEWDLSIYGEGSLRNSLEAMVGERNLGNRIFLPGVVDDIKSVYIKADIFVSSSRYEGFGLAAAEAMAMEVPCVGFRDCPGINEIVTHEENGLLTEGLGDSEKLAEQMKALAGNHTLRASLGAGARESMKKFNVSSVVDKWEALIHNVAKK